MTTGQLAGRLRRPLQVRSVAVVAGSVAATALLLLPVQVSAAESGAVTIGPQAMEGNLQVHVNDVLKAGFDFTVPGSHRAETIDVVDATVTFLLTCDNGASVPATIALPDATVTLAAGDNNWYPTGNQADPASYQASTSALDQCNGAQMHDAQGSQFSAQFESSDTLDTLNVRFHYVDVMQHNASSWSGTARVQPGPIPAPTPAPTQAPVPSTCPSGQSMSSSGHCAPSTNGCTSGQSRNASGQCATSPPPSCPNGQAPAAGAQCVATTPTATPSCADGQGRTSAGQCASAPASCGLGQTRSASGQCVTAPNPTPSCATGQGRDSAGQCVHAVTTTCASGQAPAAGGQCATSPTPACASGRTRDAAGRCVSDPPSPSSMLGAVLGLSTSIPLTGAELAIGLPIALVVGGCGAVALAAFRRRRRADCTAA